ncbi:MULTISPECIES: nucleotide exchange factor GrpE [unclassified Lentilitoribacter]|jgi:molecular chaperone GrpE|uniref:nucleotide exchange factor GrpE n=1 Tax=unclassified Lentilitoribacter TaxID=2647570 RepID=UPI0013A70498|nr:nucleotide exchange factor GrpE [Lentilitoribacter sp. Alg239-R112]
MSQEAPENSGSENVDNKLEEILEALNKAEEKIDASSLNEEEAGEADQSNDHEVLEKLLLENQTLKDDALRAVADMQNLRKRTQREIQDAKTFSVSSFAKDMLGVADNLRRTIEAAPKAEDGAADENLKALLEGVEMTERSMLSALERHGVKKLDVMGKKFDPNFHQAMFEVPDTETPNNTVVNVVQDGYVIGTRVLRPAMVGVAKGGPKIVEQDIDSKE